MLLHIELPREKAATWIGLINRIITAGEVSHMELESIIGKLSFTQTSVFGRIGRGMMAPLYAKLKTFPYHQSLSVKELTTLRWWTVALDHMKPRIATPKPKLTQRVVYTDAAGRTRIIAAVIIDPNTFLESKTINKVCATRTGRRWIKTFEDTSYIYGLEMLAILATLMAEGDDLRGKTVTFYIDNDNALVALIKNSATPTAIQALTALIWHRIRELDIFPWFERVPSKRNIADLPTRHVKIPYAVKSSTGFGNTLKLNKTVNETMEMITQGVPVEPPQLE